MTLVSKPYHSLTKLGALNERKSQQGKHFRITFISSIMSPLKSESSSIQLEIDEIVLPSLLLTPLDLFPLRNFEPANPDNQWYRSASVSF